MRWEMPSVLLNMIVLNQYTRVMFLFHIIEEVIMHENDSGKSIYMSDVFLPYYWGGDNVWKWLLLSHKRHQTICTYFNNPSCCNIINLGLQ